MRKLHFLLFIVAAASLAAYGQSVTTHNFDVNSWPDTTHWMSQESGTVWSTSLDTLTMKEGKGALDVKANLASVHSWGTFAQLGYTVPTGASPMDWSGSDSVSVWLKVKKAPAGPQNIVFRIHIQDRPTASDNPEDWIYENTTIIDYTHDWIQLRIPFYDRVSTGVEAPDSTGFIIAPSNWNMSFNNKKLDRDKIIGWSFAIVSGTIDADSVEVEYDSFERYGIRAFPVIIFNGKDFPAYYSTFTWGQTNLSVQPNAGVLTGESAVKWVQGDEYGNGWTGWGGNLTPAVNMAGAWQKDSIQMYIKADSCGPIRVQFESSNGKRGWTFTPTNDGKWHRYVQKLGDILTVVDGFTAFDSSAIVAFGIMADASTVHSGIAGRVIYFTEIWTGTPVLDVIPPASPANLSVIGGTYTNLLTWDAVPNEPGVTYNAYYSEKPWTTTDDPSVEDVPPYGLTSALANHLLRSPNTDQDVSYYYGVVSKDAAGNISTPNVQATASTKVKAKGVPTIAKVAPTSFVADGDVSEWSTITPFNLSVVSGTAHDVPNFRVTGGDADLSVIAYLAMDKDNLYVAFDVTDNVVYADTTGTQNDYDQDCPDLFIGLYDWRGQHHKGLTTGTHPDYHFRFSRNRIKDDATGIEVMHVGDPNYAWVEKSLTSGYVVEAKIPFALLKSKFSTRNDTLFTPIEGMRIPMDFAINDNDGTGSRHAIMCYSEITFDNSYQDQWRWTYTWIGNKWTTTGVKQTSEAPQKYALNQNYPNPFNPSTQITYSLAKAGQVTLKVYDVIGREVATLVNAQQTAGTYAVSFSTGNDGKALASGVYFYRLQTGSFVSTHKMMLLK